MKEAMRLHLQTLARAMTKTNLTKVLPGKGSTDMRTIYMQDFMENMEIVPGIKCSRAEAWVATKALCAHEAGHILFSSKQTLIEYVRWCMKEHHRLAGFAKAVFNIIEDARIERATALRYPETGGLFHFINQYDHTNAKACGNGLLAFRNGLLALALIGDIPDALRDEEVLELLAQCRVHIERGRLGSDSQVAADAAKEVLKIARPLMETALEDLAKPAAPPATYNPEEAPSGDTSQRKKPETLGRRLKEQKEKKKTDASPEPDDSRAKSEPASGSAENPEDDAGKEDSEDADDSEETGSMDNEASPDDLDEEPGEPEESPDESGSDPEASDTGGQETEAPVPEASPEDGAGKEESAGADDAPEDTDDDSPEEEPESADADENAGDEEEPESADADEDSGWPEEEPEAEDSPRKPDLSEDSEDDVPADDGEEEPDADDSEDEFPGSHEDDVAEDDEPATGASGTHDGSSGSGDNDQDGDSSEDVSPEPPEDSYHPDDSKELLRDAQEEIAAIDRRERDIAGKKEDVPAEALAHEITWDACHRGIALRSSPVPFHRGARELKALVMPLGKKLAGEIRPLLLPRNNAPLRGQTKGRVDARALHKYPGGDKNLFYKKAEPSHGKDVAAYLLIDGSGSMGFENKYLKAREASLLCHLALRSLQVVHAATLFTAICSERTVIHEEIVRFSESLAADHSDNFVAIRPIGENRDGYSIRIAAKELLLRPEKTKLLFVLSDGDPWHPVTDAALTYCSEPAILDTRRAVLEATRNGVLVIGVHFGDAPSEKHRLMYNNLVYSKTENLPAALGAAVKRALK